MRAIEGREALPGGDGAEFVEGALFGGLSSLRQSGLAAPLQLPRSEMRGER